MEQIGSNHTWTQSKKITNKSFTFVNLTVYSAFTVAENNHEKEHTRGGSDES
jgi:hypothetical protein